MSLILFLAACGEENNSSNDVDSENSLPVASAGTNQVIPISRLMTLDGSNSFDPDNDSLSFIWSITSLPPGSEVTELTDGESEFPSFIPDKEGNYQFSLIVSDGKLYSPAVSVTHTAFYTKEHHESMVEDFFLDCQGNESFFNVNNSWSSYGTSGEIEVIGAAFCFPSDLYVSPAESSIPPETVYGCTNNISLTISPGEDFLSVQLTVIIPELYLDLSGVYNIGSSSKNYTGYAKITGFEYSAGISLLDRGAGVYGYIEIESSSVECMVEDFDLDDAYLDLVGDLIIGLAEESIKGNLENSINEFLGTQFFNLSGILFL
jgi:hypothetical protein